MLSIVGFGVLCLPTCIFQNFYDKNMVVFIFAYLFIFETGSHYLAQDGLELVVVLPCILSTGVTGVHHHTWALI
jgi:hypothetical protein